MNSSTRLDSREDLIVRSRSGWNPWKWGDTMSVTENAGGNPSTHAPMVDLHEIQATVLMQRPAPYFGAHVALRVDDARASRELLRRLIPHVDSAANWWMGASAWMS